MAKITERSSGRSKTKWLAAGAFVLLCGVAWKVGARKLQEYGLRKYSLTLCDTSLHTHPSSCEDEVERLFPSCVDNLINKKMNAEEYTVCLGFKPPPPPPGPVATLAECDASHMVAKVAVTLAKPQPVEGGTLREIGGDALYLAPVPIITSDDVGSLRVQEQDGARSCVVQISEAASARFARATGDNVGARAVFEMNGHVTAPVIHEPVTARQLTFMIGPGPIDEYCRKDNP